MIIEKLYTPYMFSIRMCVVLTYPLWGSMAMSIVAYGITYLRIVKPVCNDHLYNKIYYL